MIYCHHPLGKFKKPSAKSIVIIKYLLLLLIVPDLRVCWVQNMQYTHKLLNYNINDIVSVTHAIL